MNSNLLTILLLAILPAVTYAITAADIYTRLLERERNVDNTFAFQFVKPIGSVAGELIWPRSYSTSSELMFDENGAAFNLHERPTLYQILQRTRTSSLKSASKYADSYDANNNLRS